MTSYNKTKTGSKSIEQLQAEINSDVTIAPSCTAITTTSEEDLILDFAAALSESEETQLDAIILAHVKAPDLINVTELPKSTIDGVKLSVHTSYKPEIDGAETYAIWTGAGDDVNDATTGNGNGPLLQINSEVGVPTKTVLIEFNPVYGRVWLHEAYMKFTNGGAGDYMSATIYAYPVPLQTSVNLDLVVENDYIKYSATGPGTGTHGFADASKITLVDRTFSADGDWEFDGTNLTPNLAGTGQYKMSTVEQVVHRFFNKVPCYGDCAAYVTMSSDETTELRAGYFAKLTAHNISNTEWSLSCFMELYRQVTYSQ